VNFLLAVTLIIAAFSVVYVIATPKKGEVFTQFYILDSEGNTSNYPKNLTAGENASLIIGIFNHEYKMINYTVEIWLVNQTTTQNESTNESVLIYNHLWFMDKIFVTLNHTSIEVEGDWEPPWEYNYSFKINQSGYFKLVFLLYTFSTEEYSYDIDYKDIALEKISEEHSNADYITHLWIDVKF
jgi:uncharacterized membrane protein